MRREKLSRLALSRFAQASMVGLMALMLAAAARADTIDEFCIENGTAQNVSGESLGSCANGALCPFSGTITVDVTTGAVTAVNITFPGLAVFKMLSSSEGSNSTILWFINAVNTNDLLLLDFISNHRPAGLVGFNGGDIFGGADVTSFGGANLYRNITGTIAPVPEPSSLALLGTGLIGLCGMVRRKLKR